MKNNTEIYAAIVAAKNYVMETSQWDNPLFTDWENATNDYYFATSPSKLSYNAKVALLTVLTVGTFYEYNGFMMPSTKDCINAFPIIKKAYDKKRPIKATVMEWQYDYKGGNNYPGNYFTVTLR